MPTELSEEKLKQLYFPPVKEPVVVRVPKMNFLMVDGCGHPRRGDEFTASIGVLYGTAYTMKFMYEKGHPIRDGRVQPLEGLFWMRGRKRFDIGAGKELRWTLMLRQPACVNRRAVRAAIEELRKKKDPPGLAGLRFGSFAEGWSVQVMHIGPYSAEQPTIEMMHDWAGNRGYRLRGKHHEVYLSDPQRTKPERLKTVIRHPVEKRK